MEVSENHTIKSCGSGAFGNANTTIIEAIYENINNYMKSFDVEKDANSYAEKELKGNIPYINGEKEIKINGKELP